MTDLEKLEDQASRYASRETTDLDEWEFIFRKKFAELIVKECADNIAGNIDLINPESSYNYGLRRAMNSVKEHFGVEL